MLLKLRGAGITPGSSCGNKHRHHKCKNGQCKNNNCKNSQCKNNRGIATLAVVNGKGDEKMKHLTYDTDIESDIKSSGESKNNKEFDKSCYPTKCTMKSNNYKSMYRYKCEVFSGELTVIRGKCAMLKFTFEDKSIKHINKGDLPYKFPMMSKDSTKDFLNNEKCYCEKISKYIMYNHANKLNKLNDKQKKKYIDNKDFKEYISQYE